jgi:hypothetical protein
MEHSLTESFLEKTSKASQEQLLQPAARNTAVFICFPFLGLRRRGGNNTEKGLVDGSFPTEGLPAKLGEARPV